MAVTSAEITSRTPFENGNSWGKVGAYERIDGMINFEVEPDNPSNSAIIDPVSYTHLTLPTKA